MKIGYLSKNYPEKRCIIDKCCGAEYVPYIPFDYYINRIISMFRLPVRMVDRMEKVFRGGVCKSQIFSRPDIFHFFNTIPIYKTKTPYVITFEDSLPYHVSAKNMNPAVNSLMTNRCSRLLALSNCALKRQKSLCAKLNFALPNDKIEVLYPPQEVLATEKDVLDKRYRNKKRILFIGSDFYRKGGGATLKACVELRKSFEIELMLVGNIDSCGFAEDRDMDIPSDMRRLITENNWVKHYTRLPNDEVLHLMKTCDVGVLPTRDETFGYSVLEMQASGLPVVSTDVWALTEINNNDCGWLISVTKDELNRADVYSREGMSRLDDEISSGLTKRLADVLCSDENVIKRKAMNSLRRVRAMHNPIDYSNRLTSIYAKCATC